MKQIAQFNVVSLCDREVPLLTTVEHACSDNRDVIRIVQDEPGSEEVVVLLDRSDFERIYNQLKGH